MTRPYFYIIRHIPSGKKYAGVKWGEDADPSNFLKINGYYTSSNKIKSLIEKDGLAAFEIIEIVTEFNDMHPYEYETNFLIENDCGGSDEWFNGHNNTLFSLGTPEYEAYMLKNYGVKHVNDMPESWEKRKRTCNEKYGTDWPMGSAMFYEKCKQTNLNKYGVENCSQVPHVKEAKRLSCVEHFGVNHNFKDKKQLEKRKETYLKNYGVDNPSKDEGIKFKKAQTRQKTFANNPERKRKYLLDISNRMKALRASEPDIFCPVCGKRGRTPNLMQRWHFDNCRIGSPSNSTDQATIN